MLLSRKGSLGTFWEQQNPLTTRIATESQWVTLFVVNLEKMITAFTVHIDEYRSLYSIFATL